MLLTDRLKKINVTFSSSLLSAVTELLHQTGLLPTASYQLFHPAGSLSAAAKLFHYWVYFLQLQFLLTKRVYLCSCEAILPSPSGFTFCSCTAILPSELPFFSCTGIIFTKRVYFLQLCSYFTKRVYFFTAVQLSFLPSGFTFCSCAAILLSEFTFCMCRNISPAERFPKAGFLSTASKLFYQADCSCKAISPSGIVFHLTLSFPCL